MKNVSLFTFALTGIILISTGNLINAQTVSIDSHYEYLNSPCIAPVTGNLYVHAETSNYTTNDSVDFYINFGDGNDTLVTMPLYFYSSVIAYAQTNYIPHNYATQGNYPVVYIATMPDGNADTLNLVMMVTTTCNNVTGRAYVDVNSNCIFDGGDVPIQNYHLHLDYNNWAVSSTVTDAQGLYVMSAAVGFNYQLFGGGSYYDPTFTFSCSAMQGMTVTPSPNVNQDMVGVDMTSIHIGFAGDSSAYYNGNCVPLSVTFYLSGGTYGYSYPNDSADLYINFGDGNDTLFKASLNGPIGNYGVGTPHIYTAPGNYNALYIATGSDGRSDTTIQYNHVVVSDTCGTAQGDLYIDNNGNCIMDAGDSALAWTMLELANLTTGWISYTYTDINGHYSFDAAPGNYSVSIQSLIVSYLILTPTCPASATANITVIANNTITADFALTCTGGHDLSGSFWIQYGIFPTYTSTLQTYIRNISCATIPGSITFILDPLVHYMGVCDTTFAPNVNGDTLTWNFSTNNCYYSWYYWYLTSGCILVRGDASLQLGDTVCFTMVINPIIGDVIPANNTIHRCIPALVAFDPNEKEVSPQGTGPLGYVQEGTTFDYTVRFQNTGIATARDIFVLDSLDSDLDLSTLIVTGSDHQMEIDFLPGNVLRFNFPEINLPDSASDEMHSHAWLTYTIQAKTFLPNLTPIQNKAAIYFDFNTPVMTNSTLNTIYDPSSVHEIQNSSSITIFPVPADQYVEISLGGKSTSEISISDMTGRVIRTEKISGNTAKLSTIDLANGIYLVSVMNEGSVVTEKIVIQH
ncbi:hypothetical protein BH09BAC5_BH09BAC5_04280 [soil metagenome]